MQVKTQWPNVVLGLVGCLTSGYAVHIHRLAKVGAETGCGDTNSISCEAVMSSKWGELFGIPVGFYGLMFFAIVIVMAIATSSTKLSRQQFALQNLGIATVGFLTSMFLSTFPTLSSAKPVRFASPLT
jgi:uncharacterized membrane protein